MISIQVSGLSELRGRLGRKLDPYLRAATFAIGEQIRSRLARYPGPVVHPIQWASERQRRFYFAMRQRRGLPLGYVRQFDPMSQRLGPSWTTARWGDIGAVVGTRVRYAPYVQSYEKQQPFHRATGWVTDRQAIEQVQASGVIPRILNDALRRALGG